MKNKKGGILRFFRSLVSPRVGRSFKMVTEYELNEDKPKKRKKGGAKQAKRSTQKKASSKKTKSSSSKKNAAKLMNKPAASKASKVKTKGKAKAVKKKVTARLKKPAAKQIKRELPVHPRKKLETHLNLQRAVHNPIISPNEKNTWESKATFNPAALYADGKVHLVYRAIGDNDESVLGHAVSHDGLRVHRRGKYPVYFQQKRNRDVSTTFKIPYSSGGGWNGGCEDPRLCQIEDKVYLSYTAFDGWGSIRMTLSSISLEDFIKEKWNWNEPVHISPPGQIHKNWVLFPEKINGKYAILHSIAPKIQISYLDSLDELDGERFIESSHKNVPRKKVWDNWVRGAGPPPIKTKYGWLLLYHAMDYLDPNRYKLGAMILDFKNPALVLYRSTKPILEPDEHYENEGYKQGVVYSCGAAVIEDDLYVYYGGADKVCCVAKADLSKFLKELTSGGAPKLKTVPKETVKPAVRKKNN